jgi:hypothetical protein
MLDNETIKSRLELFNLATTAIKGIVGLAKTSSHLELRRQSDEALEKVFDAKQKYFDLQESYFELGRENRKLKTELEKSRSYVFHHSVSWRILADGSEDGPFCPICVTEGKDMRLTLRDHVDQTQAAWYLYCTKNHVEPSGARDLSRGREPSYVVPKELVREEYFSPR